jgi:hypothetical protein
MRAYLKIVLAHNRIAIERNDHNLIQFEHWTANWKFLSIPAALMWSINKCER